MLQFVVFSSWFVASVAVAELSDARLGELMEEGRRAIVAADYPAAIRTYTLVLREGDNRYSQDALEYLGVARERNGQQSHAISEYRRYLATYPESDNAARVQQRLDGLMLASVAPVVSPEPTPTAVEGQNPWEFYGGVSQYYRRDEVDYDDAGSQTLQSAVLTDIDVLTRRRGQRLDLETRVTLGDYRDLLSGDESVGSDTRFYYLYADLEDRETGLSGRLGRQTLNSGGVLGRFDGAYLAWQLNDDWKVNLTGGEPVYNVSDSDDSDRFFYGISVDRFDLAGLFDLTLFYNQQEVDGIDDREAVGAELKYYDDRRMLVSYLDYDTGYSELNSLVVLGNWTLDNEITLNASIDYRRAPYLLTENALVGQDAKTIDDLLDEFSESEVRDLAKANSGELTTVVLGFAMPLSTRFQVNGDLTISDFTGLQNEPDPDPDYFYSLSFVGSDLLVAGDSSIINLRYQDGDAVSVSSVSFDNRYPLTDKFRINPRMIVSYRESSASDADELILSPSLRLFYTLRRNVRLELDTGWRWSDLDSAAGTYSTNSWFLYAGYRADY